MQLIDFVFSKDNFNICEIFSFGLVVINYDVSVDINFDGDMDICGFVMDSFYYCVWVDVDLLFYGWVINFSVWDIFDLNLSDLDNVDYVVFKMVIENVMFVVIGVQGYFCDVVGMVLDLFYEILICVIVGVLVGVDGCLMGVQEIVIYSDFLVECFKNIKNVVELEVVVIFFIIIDGVQLV